MPRMMPQRPTAVGCMRWLGRWQDCFEGASTRMALASSTACAQPDATSASVPDARIEEDQAQPRPREVERWRDSCEQKERDYWSMQELAHPDKDEWQQNKNRQED